MSPSQNIAWLVATMVLTIIAIIFAAARSNTGLSMAAVLMFALVALCVSWRLNAATPATRAAGDTAATNAGLMALAFAWGGSAILGAYYLTDLFWHHAWQYGLGMLIIAVILTAFRTALLRPGSSLRDPIWLTRLTYLALLQGLAATAGLIFLLSSGKLARSNTDWVANHVFVAGGIVIAYMSFLAFMSQRKFLRE